MDKKILINFPAMAEFLRISLHMILQHRPAMKAAGVIERHAYQGRLYSVALPGRLNDYWRNRRFD